MTRRMSRGPHLLVVTLCVGLAVPAHAVEHKPKPPESSAPAGPRPSEIVKQLADRPAPYLTGTGEVARRNVEAFVNWASASTSAQDSSVREAMAEAGRNPDVMKGLCEEAFAAQARDHSRALVALSLIGEARSPYGEECLTKFMAIPFPEKGTVVEGEILEQTALGTLQAKAIDGLAYLRSESADKVVLEAVARHPSRLVRAEAIAAYQWNHDYSKGARETLRSSVRPEERIFLDRIVRRKGEPKESFNKRLDAYLKAHPEARPPVQKKSPTPLRDSVGKP